MITCGFRLFTDVHGTDQDCVLVIVLVPALSPEVNVFARLERSFPNALICEIHPPAVVWRQQLQAIPLLLCFSGRALRVSWHNLAYDHLEDNPYDKGFELAGLISAAPAKAGLFFSTLDYLETDLMLNGLLAAGFNGFPLLGGMLQPPVSGNAIFINGRPVEKGTVLICFEQEGLVARTAFSQGFLPFGPTFRITAAGGDEIMEVEDTPALPYFNALFDGITKLDPRQLLLGAAIEVQSESGIFCRKILGTEERRGSVFVAGEVPSGSTFRFFRGDAIDVSEQSQECLRQLLATEEPPAFIFAVSSQNRLNKFRESILNESDAGTAIPVCCLYLPGQVLIRGGTRTALNNLSFQCLAFTER